MGPGRERWRILTDEETDVLAGKGDISFCEMQGIGVADDEKEEDLGVWEPSSKQSRLVDRL